MSKMLKRPLQPGKRYRGSAVVDSDGEFKFTPYNECAEDSSFWDYLYKTKHVTLRKTRKCVQLNISVPYEISNDVAFTMRAFAIQVLLQYQSQINDRNA